MSSKNEQCKLKAGHLPAVKAGKMRITQHKQSHDSSNSCSSSPSDDTCPLKVPNSLPETTVVSGATIHGHCDYPAEAVQKYHEKPLPRHEARCNSFKPIIQQPKKQ